MKQNKTEFKAKINLKRIYSEKKFLVIGLIVSLLIHVLFFSLLYFTKPTKKEKKKEEKTIEISLIPYEKVEKIQKHVGKKEVLKKRAKKRVVKKKKLVKPKKKVVRKKPVVKPEKRAIKKIKKKTLKKIQKKVVKKEIPKTPPKEIVKKEKPIEKKPLIKKIERKEKQVEEKTEKELVKETKPSPQKTVPAQKTFEKPSPKNLIIPDLSKTFHEKPQKKETQKDKAVMDYLKYIKIEFERNKFYPDRAKKLGIEGIVVLKFTILPDGTIDKNSIQVVEADHPFLAKGAVRIFEKIKKLKKPPPNGEKMTVEIPIQYILYEIY